jgi:hypothetical protein
VWQALVVCGGMVFLALMGTGQAILVFWGIIPAPITASLFYMGIVGDGFRIEPPRAPSGGAVGRVA